VKKGLDVYFAETYLDVYKVAFPDCKLLAASTDADCSDAADQVA
jgi:hypothetical protein